MLWLHVVVVLFAILNLGMGIHGGIQGSWVSLAAAGGAGLIALAGALVARDRPSVGYAIVAVVCVALLGRFVPLLMRDFKVYPGGIAASASAITLICLAVGHFVYRGQISKGS